jgi:hypothetical protein
VALTNPEHKCPTRLSVNIQFSGKSITPWKASSNKLCAQRWAALKIWPVQATASSAPILTQPIYIAIKAALRPWTLLLIAVNSFAIKAQSIQHLSTQHVFYLSHPVASPRPPFQSRRTDENWLYPRRRHRCDS